MAKISRVMTIGPGAPVAGGSDVGGQLRVIRQQYLSQPTPGIITDSNFVLFEQQRPQHGGRRHVVVSLVQNFALREPQVRREDRAGLLIQTDAAGQ